MLPPEVFLVGSSSTFHDLSGGFPVLFLLRTHMPLSNKILHEMLGCIYCKMYM